MLTNVMFTTTIADLARALTTSTILMINSFLLKAIVWMCLFPTHVGIPPRDFASSSSPPFVVALIVVVLAAFFVIVARILFSKISSCLGRCRRHRKKEESFTVLLAEKKKSMVIPPITITCRHRSDCRCLCRPQQKTFVIPHVPAGFKRVLVPTPGAKCGARECIIAHDLQQPQRPRSVKPLRPKSSSTLHDPTALDSIPEVPAGFTRVLVPVPGTKCGERDYVVVQEKNGGELLDQDGDVVMTTTTEDDLLLPPAEDPKKNQTSRRIGIREKVLPFELHEQIIEHSYDHMNWTMSLMREYPPEFFLYAREITRKYNFFHGMEGDCASRLGCGIWTIAEEECSMENLESLDESFPTVEHHGVVLEKGREDDDSSLAGSDTLVAEYDEQEDDVVCDAVTAVATTTRIVSSNPTGQPKDGTHDVFAAADCCNGDSLSIGVTNQDVAMLQQGSGYYVDDKGRKRRFSLRIMAKKNQQGG